MSAAKTALVLDLEAQALVREFGLERVVFVTLTFRDGTCSASEASRRFDNLHRRVLSSLFLRAIVVPERHQSGAWHFHLLAVPALGGDYRTGFDWEAYLEAKREWSVNHRMTARYAALTRRYAVSAAQCLRGLWGELRRRCVRYEGWGRTEALPIRTTGEGVAHYLSEYLRKTLEGREKRDKGVRLVRYIGYRSAGRSHRTASVQFGWREGGWLWRERLGRLVFLSGCSCWEEFQRWVRSLPDLGHKWAWRLRDLIQSIPVDDEAMLTWAATAVAGVVPGVVPVSLPEDIERSGRERQAWDEGAADRAMEALQRRKDEARAREIVELLDASLAG